MPRSRCSGVWYPIHAKVATVGNWDAGTPGFSFLIHACCWVAMLSELFAKATIWVSTSENIPGIK